MFLCMAILVVTNNSSIIDTNIYNFVTLFTFDLETSFFKFITFFASEYGLLLMLVLVFFITKDKKYFVLIMFSALFTILLNYLLKSIFMRERPLELMIISESGFSFPSGHSMVSIGFYGYLLYILRFININSGFKKFLMFFIIMLVLLIGISRIYLGVHYPTDVIAGYSIASSFLILYIEFTRRFLNGSI